jgi:hypothetical protein
MITCMIVIKEVDGGNIACSMDPDMSTATKQERIYASIMDAGLGAAMQYALEAGGEGGELIEGKNISAYVRKMLEEIGGAP